MTIKVNSLSIPELSQTDKDAIATLVSNHLRNAGAEHALTFLRWRGDIKLPSGDVLGACFWGYWNGGLFGLIYVGTIAEIATQYESMELAIGASPIAYQLD